MSRDSKTDSYKISSMFYNSLMNRATTSSTQYQGRDESIHANFTNYLLERCTSMRYIRSKIDKNTTSIIIINLANWEDWKWYYIYRNILPLLTYKDDN